MLLLPRQWGWRLPCSTVDAWREPSHTSRLPARHPSRDHWGLPENWILHSSPWRNLQTPQPCFPWRQNWMLLGEGACPWLVVGTRDLSRLHILPTEGLGYEAGDTGMDSYAHKFVLRFAPGKMSPVIQGVMVYFTFWWSGTTGHFWSPTTKSLWLHFHSQGLFIVINTNLT